MANHDLLPLEWNNESRNRDYSVCSLGLRWRGFESTSRSSTSCVTRSHGPQTEAPTRQWSPDQAGGQLPSRPRGAGHWTSSYKPE